MSRSSLGFFLISITVFFLPWSAVQAVPMSYQTNKLTDNTWEYTYTVNNTLPSAIDAFTVYFAPGRYENLVITGSPNADWDGLAVEPDSNLPDDGFADWLTLGLPINAGETLSGFTVAFDFLGTGTPGAQSFEVMDPVTFAVLSTGLTVLIPEPGTLLLVALGLAGLFRRSSRRTAPGL